MTFTQRMEKIQKDFNVNAIYAKNIVLRIQEKNEENFWKQVNIAIMQKPKPFVKWVGGKRQLLKQFRDMGLYPPVEFNPEKNRYFEPFVGGGAVFFDLLPQKAFLSDMNSELITTYNVIKNDVEKLIMSLKKHKHEKEYYYSIREKDPSTMTDVAVASRFIYLNRTGFNGMYRVNKSGKYNVPFGKNKNPLICDETNLRRVSETLKHVEIARDDYKNVLKKAKKGDFIYFDPPYHPVNKTAAFTSYTPDGFREKEQIELRDTFLKLHKRGCFVMLSNSDAPFINKIYSEVKNDGIAIHKVQAGRAINSKGNRRGKIFEVLITNY